MIRTIFFLIVVSFPKFLAANQLQKENQKSNEIPFVIEKDSLLKLMDHVADRQIAYQEQSKVHDLKWNNAVFYIGLMELSKISKDSCYRKWLLKIGRKYNWQPFFKMYMADDIAVSQMYLDMSRIEGEINGDAYTEGYRANTHEG